MLSGGCLTMRWAGLASARKGRRRRQTGYFAASVGGPGDGRWKSLPGPIPWPQERQRPAGGGVGTKWSTERYLALGGRELKCAMEAACSRGPIRSRHPGAGLSTLVPYDRANPLRARRPASLSRSGWAVCQTTAVGRRIWRIPHLAEARRSVAAVDRGRFDTFQTRRCFRPTSAVSGFIPADCSQSKLRVLFDARSPARVRARRSAHGQARCAGCVRRPSSAPASARRVSLPGQ